MATPFQFSRINVKLNQVKFPTHVSLGNTTVVDKNRESVPAALDVYGGFVQINASEGQGTTQRYTCRTFIPINTNSKLRVYDPDDPGFDNVTSVSLAATSPNGAHVAIESIDAAHVILGSELGQPVLLLEFDIGIRWTEIIQVAYSITVVSVNATQDIPAAEDASPQ
jgi:hypothetical protein